MCAKVTVRVGTARLKKIFASSRDLKLIMTSGVERVVREHVGNQFASGGPGWPKRKPFGDKPGGLAFEGSSYRRAWEGGAGSAAAVQGQKLVIGVEGARFHYSDSHQKGAKIKPKQLSANGRPKMFYKLRKMYGVNLRAETLRRGLVLPARPHARKSADLTRKIGAEIKRAIG